MSLADKVVIITGASRGIGHDLALAFAREGSTVIAAARKERGGPGSLEETVDHISREGGSALAVRCDLAVATDIESLIGTTLDRYGRIDVLINNAAVGFWKGISDLSVEEWDTVISVNLRSIFLACKYALPSMIYNRKGNIINVSAEMANQPRAIAYAASKAGLNRLTLDLAGAMQEYNIAINVLLPGLVETDMARASLGPLGTGRIPEPAEVVVPSTVWLAQQDASTVTGQLLRRYDFGRTWGPQTAG